MALGRPVFNIDRKCLCPKLVVPFHLSMSGGSEFQLHVGVLYSFLQPDNTAVYGQTTWCTNQSISYYKFELLPQLGDYE